MRETLRAKPQIERLAQACPAFALRVVRALEDAGHEAWIVGGWVRDALLGIPSHDIDVTTSALWQESACVLRAAGLAVEETGTAHGTVTAYVDGEPVEVTTYRVDGDYSDRRHPDEVRFVRDVREDLGRRDLTFNAMAWHPKRGLLDPFQGCADLEAGIVRTVGDPSVRFYEDALRMLRTVRFSVRLGYDVEKRTQDALDAQAGDLSYVAPERMGRELDAIVREGHAGRALMEQPAVMCAAIPELAAMRGFDQRSVFHVYDVYEHTAHVCCATEAFRAGLAPAELRWAALLHDVAKPATFSQDVEGHGHFFDHPRHGSLMARDIMHRLGIPASVTDAAVVLIRYHDEPLPATELAIRKLLSRLAKACPGREVPLAFCLFDLMRSDAVSKRPSAAAWAHELDKYTALLRAEAARGPVFQTRHLAVNGGDVMRACGVRPGPAVGMQLEQLLRAVMRGEVANERSELLRWLAGPIR